MGVLTYIDSPFKLLVVLLLGVVGYIGYFVYANQGLLINVYLKNKELPKLDEDRFDIAASMLFRETKAEIVSIFAVDPILNRRVLVRAYAKDGGRQKLLEGTNVGLFSSNHENNADVIRLMAGEVPCGAYARPQSEAGLWYIHQGVRFTCRVSVPPDISQFIGQVTVGWLAEPDLEYARSIMEVVARGLVKDKR
ncbi:hypothetical protein UFOVP381_43 [uncultured Caudovirales phage]|uniref:Uncharacterized protein n=1 Tax=uncultured Caudovirales phage TaxID=2100421 RepID=A0A6J7WZ96_9CAUD|nr:hypothetical protein UFOVP381_43 [uncultured Caudovirales phage]